MIDQMVQRLAGIGEPMVRWFAWMNVWTLVVLAGAVVIDWATRRRVSAAWRMALYSAVLLRLLLPVGWSSPVGLIGNSGRTPALSSPMSGDTMGHTTLQYESPPMRSTPSHEPPTAAAIDWRVFVPVAYLGGAAALIIRGLAARSRLRRMITEAHPADNRMAALAHPLPVLVHHSAGPMLVGLRRSRLVLPARLAAEVDSEQLPWIVQHEQAHARRRDPWMAMLIHFTTVAMWPVAPVWIAGSRLRALMEQACDEQALAGRGEQERLSYAQTLIDAMMAPRRLVTEPLTTSPALEFGVGLRERIVAITFTRRWRPGWQGGLAAAAAAALVACAGTRQPNPPPEPSYQTSSSLSASQQNPLPSADSSDRPNQTAQGERPWLLPQDDPRPIRLEFTLLDKWPVLPWLDATPDGRGPANGGMQMLYGRQRDELLEAVAKQGHGVISSPQVLVRPGQHAAISVGDQRDAAGGNRRSITIRAGATRNKGGYDIDVQFTETGPDARSTGSVTALALRDHTEVIPIRESRPGQGGMLLLVRVSDEPASAVGWPIVFYRVNRVELAGTADFTRAVEASGGRKIDGINAAAGRGAAYTLPAEFIEPLYDKLGVPEMKRFRIGQEQHIQAVSGEVARFSLTSAPEDGRLQHFVDEFALRPALAPPADRPGPVQGGSMFTGLTWTSADGVAIDVPSVQLANYDAAAHHLAIAVFWPGAPGDKLPPRLLIVMPHRAGSADDLPRQTQRPKPQTFTP